MAKEIGALSKALTRAELQLLFVRANINRVDGDDANGVALRSVEARNSAQAPRSKQLRVLEPRCGQIGPMHSWRWPSLWAR